MNTSFGLFSVRTVSIRENVAYFCASEFLSLKNSYCFGVDIMTSNVSFFQKIDRIYSTVVGINNQAQLVITSSNFGATEGILLSYDLSTSKLLWSMEGGVTQGVYASMDNNGVIFTVNCDQNSLVLIQKGFFLQNVTIPNSKCSFITQNPLITSDGSIYVAISGLGDTPGVISKFT